MNHKINPRIVIVFILVFATLGVFGSLAAAQAPQENALVSQPTRPDSDTTLDVCMYSEPDSLYFYSNSQSIEQARVLSAVYDGPMDTRSYTYQPVIFEAVPTFENGQAITQTTSISEGQTIVDSSGNVVSMAIGTSYLPSGCYEASCAVTYSGGSVDMEQIVVKHTLLPGLLWSDGHPLTTADMVYSFNLNADPDTPGDKELSDRTDVYATNSLTQTEWTGLAGYFPFDYANIYWTPLPEHRWGAYSAAELVTAEVSNRTPLGWGPYVIDEWVAGSHISMHKNPLYFRAAEGLPHFENLDVHFGTEVAGILDGTCDVVVSSYDDLGTLLGYDDAGTVEVVTVQNSNWEHLDFGIQSSDVYTGFAKLTGAFQDVRVRQAFAYCIDRQAIADTIFYGLAEIPNSIVPDGHPYFPLDATIYPFDPVAGQALLEDAGWIDSNGDGIRDQGGVEFSITLKTTTAPIRYTVVSMIATQMAACGIEVIPNHMSSGDLFANWPDGPVFGRKYDLAEFAWVSPHQPPCVLYQTSSIPSDTNPEGQNNPGYSNPAYDTACQSAFGSLTEADRQANFGAAIRIFTEELPVLPLFLRLNVGITAPYITGFTLDPTESSIWNIEELRVGIQGIIPPGGGGLDSPADNTSYLFGEGTFADTVVITHTALSPLVMPGFGDLTGAGHYFNLEATLDDLPVEPSLPYTMTIEYSEAELGMVVEDTLGLYYWNGSAWALEPTAVVDPVNNSIVALPIHFSDWALLGEVYQFRFIPLVVK
jgi:peptide/nickel transport system substrate-binding protein